MRLAFVDFGMAAEITPAMRALFRDAVLAVVRKDADGLVTALLRLGFIRKGASLAAIRRSFQWVFEHYTGLSVESLSYEVLEEIQEDVRTIMYEQSFRLPVGFAFAARAVGILLGLITRLEPEFDVVEALRPHMEELMRQERPALASAIYGELRSLARVAAGLPRQLDQVLSRAVAGELRVKVDSRDIVASMDRYRRSRSRQSGLVAAGTLAAAAAVAYFLNFQHEALALAIAAPITLFAVWTATRVADRERF